MLRTGATFSSTAELGGASRTSSWTDVIDSSAAGDGIGPFDVEVGFDDVVVVAGPSSPTRICMGSLNGRLNCLRKARRSERSGEESPTMAILWPSPSMPAA